MKHPIQSFFLISVLFLTNFSAHTMTIYKGVDQHGNVIYSDKPIPGDNTKKMNLNELPSPSKNQIEQYKKQLKLIDNSVAKRIAKRQALQSQLKQAYAELAAAQSVLDKARKQQQQQYQQCLNQARYSNQGNGTSILCAPQTIDAVQAEVSKIQMKINRLLTQLDEMR